MSTPLADRLRMIANDPWTPAMKDELLRVATVVAGQERALDEIAEDAWEDANLPRTNVVQLELRRARW